MDKKTILKRKENFNSFLNERMPLLVNFMTNLGYEQPHLVLLEAEKFIPTLSAYLKGQEIDSEDRNWLTTVIGYFIGEVLVQKYDGLWFFNEDANSMTYGKYVVGGFSTVNKSIAIDPFNASYKYVNNIEKKDLESIIQAIFEEIEQLK